MKGYPTYPSSAAYLKQVASLFEGLDAQTDRFVDALFKGFEEGRTIFLCGNGGSAANAAHIAADLMKLTAPPGGPRLRVLALGESLPGLTAAANDFAYEEAYAEQLKAFLEPGDVVIGLSTSGSSPNVLRTLEYAAAAGATTVGITSTDGAALRARVEHAVLVPSRSVQHVEDATMVVGHLLCLRVRDLITEGAGVLAADSHGAGQA